MQGCLIWVFVDMETSTKLECIGFGKTFDEIFAGICREGKDCIDRRGQCNVYSRSREGFDRDWVGA